MARLTHSCLRTSRFSLNFFALRRITAIALMLMLTVLLAPLPVQAAVLQSFERKLSAAGSDVWSWWDAVLGSFARGPSDRERKGVRPVPPLSKDELEARVASLEMNPAEEITLQSRQPLTFTAIPLDAEGNTVHGVRPLWRSSDRQVIFIKKNGEAVAGKPGKAVVIARVRNQQATVRVTVVEGTREPYGGKKKVDSTRSVVEEAAASNRTASPREGVSRRKRAHAGKLSRAGVMPFIRNPNEDPLPDNETSSIYQPNNLIGTPPGKKKPGALTASSVVSATESGNKNFNFELPVVGMPGRGIDVALSLVYNSLLWNKSVNPSTSQTWMTYDVDSGYPAQGFRLGYGQLEDQGSAGFTLTDANGTRHALVNTSQFNYDSTDGTFIHFTGGSGWGAVTYSDGTIVGFGAAGGGLRSYPTSIQDRNGNYIFISYVNGVGPRIYSITDTVGRLIRFYYDSNNDLVAITKPGLTSQSDLQVMRFYYETLTLPSGLFGSGINVNKPSSARVIRYIYQPVSSEGSTSGSGDIGYRFDYSQYGMIYQMVKFHGMTASTTSTSSTGTVTEGTQAAITTYGYPTTAGALTDVPTFSSRTDDWAGRTNGGSAPQYSFSVSETSTETTSTVTAPDTSVTVSVSIKNSGAWNDGLVKETRVQNSSSVVFSKTVIDWEQNSVNGTPRVASIRQTNEAGKTAATVLSYDSTTPYNNISVMSERDFTTNGTVSSTELRRTETTYLTSSSYLNRRLLHLPSMVKMFPGSSSTPAFRVDYGYDNYGSSHENLTARNDIIMHDPAYDPYQETQETCDWVCNQYDHWGIECIDWRQVCTYYNPYNPDTDYRGNVTSITTYPDATTTSGAITRATTYDIAGNVMTEEVDCCQSQSYTYSSTNSDYAYPVSITKGNPSGLHLTTTFTYDMNTGLVATMTEANNRTTSFSYNSDTLSTDHIDFPDGGQLSYDYFNALAADSAGRYHFSIVTSTRLDSTRYLDSKSYFDGRGALRQTYDRFTSSDGWSVSDIEYDSMGRAYRSSYPYYCTSNYGTCSINPSGVWSTRTFDTLGRITQVTTPRGDDANPSLTRTAQTTYEGDVTTSTDHAGKQRRQIVDALGRMIRLDEPNSSGSLGAVGSPAQSTSFMYDVLDNLVKITQGSQERFFKYDSLSRLIRERQVEQTTNSAYNLSDSLTGNSTWTRKLEYNSQGLVTNAYDARGVQTSFSYDGLNRVTLIDYSDSTPDARYYYDSQTLPSGAPSYTHGDANGRLIAMTYGSSSSTTGTYFGYDNMGRINVQKQVTGANTYSLGYTYNLAGLLSTETYPTGRVLTHSYDNAGRLSQISDGTTNFASGFSYAASGGMLSETWGNGAVHSIAYNNALQVSQVKLKQSSSGSELQRYDYLYGQVTQSSGSVDKSKNNGQIGRVDGVINGASTKEWEQRYSYDELGRLSLAAEFQQGTGSTPSWQQEFTYDRYGNRFQSGSNNFGVAFTPVVSGDITASTNRFITSGSTPVTYDNAGNITQDAKFRFMNYTYDANWRQVSVAATNSDLSQTSVYDCAGQRVQTTSNGVTRTMVYDIFGQLVADYNGATMERENIYRDGQVLAVYEAASTCYMTIADFVTSFYQGALNRNPNSTELAEWTGKLSQAQAQGNGRLIKVAQDLGAAVFTSTEYTNLNTSNADYVTDLYAAFLQRAPDSGGFNDWMNALNTGSTRTHVRNGFAYSLEFQGNVMRLCATINSGTSTSANLKYMFTDAQGSTRAVMNNSGSGTSTIVARHDYLPFGEEIWAGVGLRTTTQKYAMTDKVRQRFALTERDEASGLDHTWFRKYDSFAGRFTSPDLMAKRAGNPQDLNAYHYTQNDPINAVDPTGLLCFIMTVWGDGEGNFEERCVWFGDWDPFTGFQPRDRVPGDPQRGTPPAKKELTEEECNKKIAAIFGGQGAVAATVNEPPGVNIGPGANRNRYDHLAGQGVFHIYTDAQGSNKTTGLYIPKGGNFVRGGEYDNKGDTENYFRYSYTSGPYRGVDISLVHVGGTHGGDEGGKFLGDFKGETNAAGSERIGNIGGLGGEGNGYNHTHVVVRLNGKRIDPRKVFCKKK